MKLLDNAKSHFRTITAHRHKVMEHCFRAGIGFQGLFHDLSKYSPTEFIPGMKYYQGDRSPNEKERETIGYSNAWMQSLICRTLHISLFSHMLLLVFYIL